MQVEFQHIIYLGHVFSIRCWNISIHDRWNRREGGWGVSNIVYHLDFRLLYMSSNYAAVAAYQKDDSKVSTRTATEELRSLQRRVSQLTSLVDQLQAEVICILFIRIFVYKHITLLGLKFIVLTHFLLLYQTFFILETIYINFQIFILKF